MPIRFRKRIRLYPLPVYINLSRSGISFTVASWPWSWNSRTGEHSVDLPGPFSWKSGRRKRSR